MSMTADDWEKCKYEDYDVNYTYDNDEYEVDDYVYAHVTVYCHKRCTGYCEQTYESPAEYDYDDWETELEKLDFYDEYGKVEVPVETYERIKKAALEDAVEEAQRRS